MSFLQTYKKIILKVRTWTLIEKDVKTAFKYASVYGAIKSINFDGIYSDVELEKSVHSLVMQSGKIDIKSISSLRGDGVLVLATELYDYGGHSKIVLAWLELMKEILPHKLIITRTLTERTEKLIKDIGIKVVKIPCVNLENILAILDTAKGFNRLVMHTHPEDIGSSVIARILSTAGYEIIFYNHADHLFNFGLSSANTVCEISDYGEKINQRTGRLNGQSVRLGIPLKKQDLSKASIPVKMHLFEGYQVVISAGSPYKYQPDESFLFADYIDKLLARKSNIKIALVGPTGNETWWKEKRASWGQRVLFFGVTLHAEYIQLLKIADVYVDSYPLTGGTAFPEALLAGKSCIGLSTKMQGYSLADNLKVNSVADLVNYTAAILERQPDMMLLQKKVREQVANSQSEDAFKNLISDIYKHKDRLNNKDNKRSQSQIDSYLLEKKWLSTGTYTIPKKILLAHLPIHRSFQIFCLMLWGMLASKLTKNPRL